MLANLGVSPGQLVVGISTLVVADYEALLAHPALAIRVKLIQHFAAHDTVLFDTTLDTSTLLDHPRILEPITEPCYTTDILLPSSRAPGGRICSRVFTFFLLRPGEASAVVFSVTTLNHQVGRPAGCREDWGQRPGFDEDSQIRLEMVRRPRR